jgi:small subunit ribosomal protein S11
MAEVKNQKKKAATKDKPKKKKKLASVNGAVHIHSTINNTIVTITDEKGNTLT